LLLIGLPILPLPLAAVFWLVTPPLQNYYLIAYFDSTERPRQPSATTQVEWLYKTAPGRKPELVSAYNPIFVSPFEATSARASPSPPAWLFPSLPVSTSLDPALSRS
jgi:hypothetical protein